MRIACRSYCPYCARVSTGRATVTDMNFRPVDSTLGSKIHESLCKSVAGEGTFQGVEC